MLIGKVYCWVLCTCGKAIKINMLPYLLPPAPSRDPSFTACQVYLLGYELVVVPLGPYTTHAGSQEETTKQLPPAPLTFGHWEESCQRKKLHRTDEEL